MTKRRTYGLQQAAKELGVHSSTVIRWLNERRVPRVKKKKDAQGHYVFSETDVKELIEYHTSVQHVD